MIGLERRHARHWLSVAGLILLVTAVPVRGDPRDLTQIADFIYTRQS